MAARVVVFVDVHDERLWDEGHLISNWSKKMALNLTLATKSEAPINKRAAPTRGQLAANIDSRRSRAKVRQIRINVTSRAPYSEYVIFGTPGATHRKGFNIPPHYVGKGINSATSKWVGMSFDGKKNPKKISGQPPNDYMTRGVDKASTKHPSLRG